MLFRQSRRFQGLIGNPIAAVTGMSKQQMLSNTSRGFAVEISTNQSKVEISSDTSSMGVKPLYFDNQATTPLDPRVLDKMMPFMTENFGNPHSRSHSFGWETEKACEDARE